MANIDEVRELISRRKPLIVMLSESCTTGDINDNEIECEGYELYRNDSHSRYTGG